MSNESLSYEQAMDKLKHVVDQLERGSLGLEQSLQLFEEGIALTGLCEEKLKAVEARVKVLVDRAVKGTEPGPPSEFEMRMVTPEEMQ